MYVEQKINLYLFVFASIFRCYMNTLKCILIRGVCTKNNKASVWKASLVYDVPRKRLIKNDYKKRRMRSYSLFGKPLEGGFWKSTCSPYQKYTIAYKFAIQLGFNWTVNPGKQDMFG